MSDPGEFDEAARGVTPEQTPIPGFTPPTHLDVTRRNLAYGILGLVAFLYIVIVIAAVSGLITGDETRDLLSGIGFPAGLAGAVAGFYFAKD